MDSGGFIGRAISEAFRFRYPTMALGEFRRPQLVASVALDLIELDRAFRWILWSMEDADGVPVAERQGRLPRNFTEQPERTGVKPLGTHLSAYYDWRYRGIPTPLRRQDMSRLPDGRETASLVKDHREGGLQSPLEARLVRAHRWLQDEILNGRIKALGRKHFVHRYTKEEQRRMQMMARSPTYVRPQPELGPMAAIDVATWEALDVSYFGSSAIEADVSAHRIDGFTRDGRRAFKDVALDEAALEKRLGAIATAPKLFELKFQSQGAIEEWIFNVDGDEYSINLNKSQHGLKRAIRILHLIIKHEGIKFSHEILFCFWWSGTHTRTDLKISEVAAARLKAERAERRKFLRPIAYKLLTGAITPEAAHARLAEIMRRQRTGRTAWERKATWSPTYDASTEQGPLNLDRQENQTREEIDKCIEKLYELLQKNLGDFGSKIVGILKNRVESDAFSVWRASELSRIEWKAESSNMPPMPAPK